MKTNSNHNKIFDFISIQIRPGIYLLRRGVIMRADQALLAAAEIIGCAVLYILDALGRARKE